MIYIPLHDICLRADISEFDLRVTQYSKTMIDDLRLLIAKHGLDISKVHKAENLTKNDYVIYRQRLKEIK